MDQEENVRKRSGTRRREDEEVKYMDTKEKIKEVKIERKYHRRKKEMIGGKKRREAKVEKRKSLTKQGE